jgi:acylphosphatase
MISNEKLETLERAVREIEALQAIYGDDGADFIVHSSQELLAAQHALESNDPLSVIQSLDVELRLNLEEVEGSPRARLRVTLPGGYPESAALASVSVDGLRRAQQEQLSAQMSEKAQELAGQEAVMELVIELHTMVLDLLNAAGSIDITEGESAVPPAVEDQAGFGRRWIWVHHITNTGRKKSIVREAQELKLGGFLKAGYPGVVVVEGETPACDEFVNWIKGNKSRPGGFGRNWGHHVRGEISLTSRQLPLNFEEVEEDLAVLAAACKECDLESEFLEYVMQHKSIKDGS